MDERLSLIHGRRPTRLRASDLPSVSRAIVAQIQGEARASHYRRRGVSFVRLAGINIDVTILSEDWAKIFPLLQRGDFNGNVVPSIDGDSLYRKVLASLQQVFTEDYPLSNL